MKQTIVIFLSIIFLFSCNSKNGKDKKVSGDNRYPLATSYIDQINKAEQSLNDIGSKKINSPQSERDFIVNDSLLNLEGMALDNYIKTLVDAYGNIPTDSIFERIKNYGGYIPPALEKKIQEVDWTTAKGKVAKEKYDNFLQYYDQFGDLVGLSLCDNKIELKSDEGTVTDLCDILTNGTYLVDIWASWCAPCRSFNRNFKKHYVFFKKRGIETISISTDKKIKQYQLATKKDDVPWSDFHDYTGELSKTLNIQSLPFQFIVKDGVIIKILFAGSTESQLREYIEGIKK